VVAAWLPSLPGCDRSGSTVDEVGYVLQPQRTHELNDERALGDPMKICAGEGMARVAPSR
jgi:hypothetical protein